MKRIAFFIVLLTVSIASARSYDKGFSTDNMFKAIASGDVSGLRRAILSGADLTARCRIDENGNDCYIFGHENRCLEPSDYRPYGPEEYTPLYLAVAVNEPEIIRVLLVAGAKLQAGSSVCTEIYEGDIFWELYNDINAFGGLSFGGDVKDANLQTAMVLFQYGYFSSVGDLNVSIADLIRNDRVSDEVLTEFLRALHRYNKLNAKMLDYDGRNVRTLLDIANIMGRTETASFLKSIRTKQVKSAKVIAQCKGEPNCSGPIFKVNFKDGSSKREEFCECGT